MKIAIIGLGLIGGSLAKALKKAEFYVIGVARREETLDAALKAEAIDEGSLELEAVKPADMIFICTPINLILSELKEMIPYLKKGAIVSDVGSTKQAIVSQAEKIIPKGVFFVGGHPMAGKEKVKFEAAEVDLFKDKVWFLTKTRKTKVGALKVLEEVVETTGAKNLTLDPQTHDLVVAAISHLPLAVSAALVNTVAGQSKKELMSQSAASGFRDTTRIASGDPELGVDLFSTNKKAVLKVLDAYKKSLTQIEKLIKTGKLAKIRAILEKAKNFRDSIYG